MFASGPGARYDDIACSWEWGGVPEVVPAPCTDAHFAQALGAAGPVLVLAIIGFCIIIALLAAIVVKLR